MKRPDDLETYSSIDLKLSIKSSLPEVKSALALSILLYESTDEQSILEYSKINDSQIVISDIFSAIILQKVKEILIIEKIESVDLINKINLNPLFKAQLESLIVAFELIWKLAEIKFLDSSKQASSERSGGKRFPKVISYSTNIDIIHTIIKHDNDKYLKILISWLGFEIDIDSSLEKNLTSILLILSESSAYKIVDNEKNVIFNQNSIYKKLLEPDSETEVSIKSDSEPKGSLRILNSLLADGLNPFLNYTNWKVSLKGDDITKLKNYQNRVNTFLKLSSTKIERLAEDSDDNNIAEVNWNTGYQQPTYKNKTKPYPYNRILFGAPGTGKSYTLNIESIGITSNKEDALIKNGGGYERVTFHPDYTYANFVGAYKPVPIIDSEDKEVITYKYVPGPFMRTLVKALKSGLTNKTEPYLIIIEEINRANVAAVFGDVFQLLDRKDNVSEYPIQASEDMKKYLAAELNGNFEQIRIPDNMFIWATMNSADQGVFPMDTAFKRRWNFTYLGINQGENEISDFEFTLGDTEYKVNWNELRKLINNQLLSYNVNEDKLLGPFFIPKEVLSDEIEFNNVFKNKVIMYLFDDAAKHKRANLFAGSRNYKLYSSICEEFDKKGIKIFTEDIRVKFVDLNNGDKIK